MATPTKPPRGRWKLLPSTISLDWSTAVLRAEVSIQRDLPHRNQKDHVALLAGVLLGDLQFNGLVGVPKRGEEWRDRLANLKVDRAVLDLDDHVGFELTVEGMEVVIAGPGAVGFEIVPVQMIVVNESAIQNDAAVRFECAGNGIGSLGRSTAVFRGPDAAFGVGLDDKAAEVRDGFVDLDRPSPPPGDRP